MTSDVLQDVDMPCDDGDFVSWSDTLYAGYEGLCGSNRRQEIEDEHIDDGTAMRFEALFGKLRRDAASPRLEGKGMLLTGPSGTGKSHALKRLALLPGMQAYETPEGIVRPMVRIGAPSPCTLKTLGHKIYSDLTKVELRGRTQEHEIWARVRAHLAAQKVKFLVIDEMHYVLVGRNREEQRKVAETFKTIMQMEEWPVYLVMGGTPDALPFLQQHLQLSRRTLKLEIRPVAPGDAGNDAITRYVDKLLEKLRVSAEFDIAEIVPRLRLAAGGYLGRASRLVKNATKIALDNGEEVVGLEHLAEAFRDIHAANDQEIDEASNPFLCADCSLVVVPEWIEPGRETSLKGRKSR